MCVTFFTDSGPVFMLHRVYVLLVYEAGQQLSQFLSGGGKQSRKQKAGKETSRVQTVGVPVSVSICAS